MRSINLEKTLEYIKIPKGVPYENFPEYYLCKGKFLTFFLPWKILYKPKV